MAANHRMAVNHRHDRLLRLITHPGCPAAEPAAGSDSSEDGLRHGGSDCDSEQLERLRDREQLDRFRDRALTRGVNPLLYWTARIVLLPFFLVYFRLERIGSGYVPRSGPVLLAANHRSFLDPFIIGSLSRRPVYYVAKRELFRKRWQAWVLNALGAFPVDRGQSDEEAIATARAILARGDCVVIFPEGTRVRPGPLGAPRRGIGRLALETGAPVVPIAVIGTEDVRRGWRIRPRRVRVRCGAPLAFPAAQHPSPAVGAAVTERIWARVSLQWEWLGGAPSPRRAPVRAWSPGSNKERQATGREAREARAA
jgi:glycerol-3-phosphate dehydrogenase (NAD(P)+)